MYKALSLAFAGAMLTLCLSAQTPGLIIKPASAPGKAILDPDGDGYVSRKTPPVTGIQLGFSTNDISESEIAYAPIVKPDPQGDPLAGPSCLYNEIVGTDAAGNNAVMTYYDGTNLLFRFRLGGYAANSKGYSLLIDTDQKFGFTGPNADPGAVPGNPGFEVEIVLETNFGVEVYNVAGTATPNLVVPFSTNPYSSHCQKSIALTTACSDPDYFYDFYIPFWQLTAIAGLGITPSTPLRMVAVTSMNPHAAIGNNAISDVGGVTSGNNLDAIYSSLIEGITPTSVTNINTAGLPDRSACPSVNPVGLASTAISGTTSETAGTISVSVYQSDGTTLIGTGTTSVITGGNWSVSLASFSPSVTLAAGQVVKATMTATGKGTSYDNCDIEIVKTTLCAEKTSLSGIISITVPSAGKGIVVANSYPAGTVFTLYNSDFSQAVISGVTNPITIATAGASASFTCGTGNCFPNGKYYITVRETGKCESEYTSACAGIDPSAVPTLATSPITTSTASIGGNGTTTGSQILIYADGIQIATATSAATTPFAWTAPVSGLKQCQVITVKQVSTGLCFSPATAPVTVSRQALKPVINFSGCSLAATVTSVSGFSSEAAGTTISIYQNSSAGPLRGTATVAANGTWTATGLSLTAGTTIVAKVTAGTCLSPSADSDPVTITTKTDISAYTLTINNPVEGQLAVSGTISGGTYPASLRVWVDEAPVGSPVNIAAPGSWNVSGLNSFDLAVGSKVQVTLSSTGCESSLSSTFATVQCLVPSDRNLVPATASVCSGSYGSVTVQNSETGVIYTPVLSDGVTPFGFGLLGTGSDLVLTTGQLTSGTVVRIRASKLPLSSACSTLMTGAVTFSVNPLPAAPAAPSPQTYCGAGTTTLADLAVTPPSGSSVVWYNAASGGTMLAPATVLSAGSTYYAESQNIASGCTSSSRRAVTVQNGTPAAPSAAANQSLCTGSAIGDIAASLSGPGTINWYSLPSGGTLLAPATLLVSGNTYYAETVQNSCVSATRTAVTVTLTDPVFAVGDASVTEGNSGNTANMVFTVFIDAATCEDVTVEYSTSAGTATSADSDYNPVTGVLTIPEGATSAQVTVQVQGDSKYELDENFYLTISNPSRGSISDFSGTATVLDDDTQPQVTLSSSAASMSEASGSATVTATLSNRSYQDVTVFFTFGGTAAGAGTDYTVTATSVSIPAGSLSASLIINAVQDAQVEGNESVIADISSVVNATEDLLQMVTVIIADDDITDHPPVINDAVVALNENSANGTTVYNINDAVTLGDTDQDGQSLTYTITGGNSSGAFSINAASGLITVADATKLDYETAVLFALAVRASDGINTADATVTVNLNNLNDNAPVSAGENYSVDEGATLTVPADGLLSNDSDADGNVIAAVKVSDPLHGTLTLNADGSFTYVHSGSETSSDSFSYKANDGLQDGNTVTVAITVNPLNDEPVSLPDSYTLNEGATLGVSSASGLLANDSDAEGSTLSAIEVSPPANGILILDANGSFTYIHNGSETLSDSFTYRANDGTDDGNVVTVSFTINPVNDLPVALPDSYSLNEGSMLMILAAGGVLANDSDAEASALTAIKLSDPIHGVLTFNANGSFTYLHDGSETVSDSFTYRPNDGTAEGNTVSVSITVIPVNDAPLALADSYTVNEGGTLNVPAASGLLANDTDAEGNSMTAVKVSDPLHGLLVLNPDGSFVYTHDGSETTSDSFVYRPNDGTANGSPVTVSLTIIPVNNPPLTVADSYTFNEGATVNVPAATGLLANDSDPEGNTLRAIKVSDPLHGTVSIVSNGSFTYTHDGSETTSDSFTYKANDNTSDGNTVTVAITINPVNDAPSGFADSYTVNEGGTLINGAAAGVLSNDTDAEGNSLTAIKLSDPLHGTLVLNANGAFTYVHDGSETTSDSFTYKPNDGTVDGAMVTVTITINPVNNAPLAVADTYSVNEGAVLTVPAVSGVLANDTDPEGAVLFASILTAPANGTITLSSSGAFTYTHNGSETTTDSFTYTAGDGTFSSSPATVTINITPVNDPPVTAADSYTVAEGGTLTVTALSGLLANDSDAEGSALTAIKLTDPVNGTLVMNSNGSFTYIHNGTETTSDSFTYRTSDGTLNGNTATVSITINPVNDDPLAVADSYSVAEGATLTVAAAAGLLANDTDPEGSTLSAVRVSDPLRGSLALNPDGSFVYVHDGSEFSGDSFTYMASDGSSNGNTVTVTIDIIPINDAPVTVADVYSITEGGTLTVNAALGVLANDTDADGSLLTAIKLSNPVNGSLVFSPDGSFTYIHNGSETSSDSFTYKCNDGTLDGNVVSVMILVDAVNGAPVTFPDTYTVSEGSTLTVPATTGLLANDTDTEGDALTALKLSDPVNGTLTFNADGSFTYVHNGSETTSDSFTYRATDGTLNGNIATVTLTVAPVNDLPVVSGFTKQVNEDNTLTFSTADFAAAYADAEGTALERIRIISLPANGTLRFMNNPVSANDEIAAAQLGLLTFTPASDWTGTASFGWNGSDGTAYAASPANVAVNVMPVNEAPQLANPVLLVTMDQATGPHTSAIAANVINPDGDILTTTISAVPKHGTASVDASGNILYTPDPAYSGKDSVSYQVCDNGTPPLCAGGKIIYTIVVVIPPNNAPTVTDIEKEMRQGDVLDFSADDFTGAYADSDGDALSAIKITALPSVGTLSLNGVAVTTGQSIAAADLGKLKYTPPGSFHGETYFSWTAYDGEDYSLPAEVAITVTERALFIPGGFSPNGDGVNDFFVIQGADEFVVSLKVYNRWGNLVYQNKEYRNDWDGISNSGLLISTKLPDGTYYYIVNFNNGEKDQVGYITINR